MTADNTDRGDPVYEELDPETGLPLETKQSTAKSREPENSFEAQLLSVVPTRKRFATTAEHKRAKKLWARTQKGTDDGIIFKYYCWHVIKWTKEFNKKKKAFIFTTPKVMSEMENEEKFLDFKVKHGKEILAKLRNASPKEKAKRLGIKTGGEIDGRRTDIEKTINPEIPNDI